MKYKLADLHDGTLVGVDFEWETGKLVFRVRLTEREVEIVMHDVTALECSRMFPWGESISLNDVSLSEESNQRELRVEMQSGDVLKALGKTVDVV